MSVFRVLNRRLVGFRVIELAATLVLTAMVVTVYLAKTGAGDKTDDIDHLQQQIEDTRTQIHLLKAEVANEEQPERLGGLARQYLNMQPIPAKHEIDASALADIAQAAQAVAGRTTSDKPSTGVAAANTAQPAPAPSLQPAAYAVPQAAVSASGGDR